MKQYVYTESRKRGWDRHRFVVFTHEMKIMTDEFFRESNNLFSNTVWRGDFDNFFNPYNQPDIITLADSDHEDIDNFVDSFFIKLNLLKAEEL